MTESYIEKRNKKTISKLNNVLDEYELKLDQRVNQVIKQIINHPKKVTETSFPQIPVRRHNPSSASNALQNFNRNKSMTANTDFSFINQEAKDQNFENLNLKTTFKKLETNKIISEAGRAVGKTKSYVKPKIVRKKPDILPRQLRHNPFCEKNAIKAQQLDKGILSLIQKGKIGKDVNIISAFEKGNPILNTNKAIFHNGEERFADYQTEKKERIPLKKQQLRNLNFDTKDQYQNWALTIPNEQNQNSIKSQEQSLLFQPKELKLEDFVQTIYIQILNFEVVKDQKYNKMRKYYIEIYPGIVKIIKEISKFLNQYDIKIAYIDCKKVNKLVDIPRKLTKYEVEGCLAKNKNQKSILNIASIGDLQKKVIIAVDIAKSYLKANVQRKFWHQHLRKRKIFKNLYNWASTVIIRKNFKKQLISHKLEMIQKFSQLQKKFKENYEEIQQNKHYEIHISNESIRGKKSFKQILNTQITRIFNLDNIHKHIIIILPCELDSETLNYYYKIMELQQIANYKERVTFITASQGIKFQEDISVSCILYSNSKVLRKLKVKTKQAPSYFCISYPTEHDLSMAANLAIPIHAGNVHELSILTKRSSLNENFKMNQLPSLYIQPSKSSLTHLSDEIIDFINSNKSVTKYVVKINNKHQSQGLALLSAPFSSLPEMFENTTLIIDEIDVDSFYHQFIRNGGVIEMYEQSISCVAAVCQLKSNGEKVLLGTFDKISSGFVNIGYNFPQKSIQHKFLMVKVNEILDHLHSKGHFGGVQLTFCIDQMQEIYLGKIQYYYTNLGSSLFYFKFLSEGEISSNGQYLAKVVDTFVGQDNKEEQVVNMEPRNFCYVPFLLHFGLSERQVTSFFQLCRMGGISFDLENKYGSTFLLLGSLKNSMGIITAARQNKNCLKLMLKTIQFIFKQNSHNFNPEALKEKERRMRHRENLLNVKERLQQF